jgi:hypothetical protein
MRVLQLSLDSLCLALNRLQPAGDVASSVDRVIEGVIAEPHVTAPIPDPKPVIEPKKRDEHKTQSRGQLSDHRGRPSAAHAAGPVLGESLGRS